MPNTLANLETALDAGAYWLENSACKRFARYAVAVDEHGDGISTWYCTDCGLQIEDPDEGCEHCGLGTIEPGDAA